ncbi:insulin-like growth factor-binding protein 1 [Littorina saxatilis]|uniref:insulin-like growth factor-binding protein 1 n=1 Tax=Littorina saxatilis TaxID=31220 RepID=UPI0038B62703
MSFQLLFVIFAAFICSLTPWTAHGLSCGECNHANTTESCGPPPSCNDTVLGACGCCPLCAKLEGEQCGGPWNALGSCAKGLTCRPTSTASPVLGAGGYFSETWDPAGICVDPAKYRHDHSPCVRLMEEYRDYFESRGRRSADVHPVTSSDETDDAETTTTEMETTTVSCVRKPSCTPDGSFLPRQCDGCAGECWCAFHDGREIKGTRGPYRTVRC